MAKLDIKGQNHNLIFVFRSGTYDELTELLKSRVENNQQLFSGSSILFQGDALKSLTPEELIALQKMCLDYGMVLNNMTIPAKPVVRVERKQPPAGKDLILHRTLRSGQKVHSDGSIVIWGNVHESAEITAARDVVVLGRLEGLAHAGCFGDLNSTIFALTLVPRQLRIGDRISRSSGKIVKNPYPEIAYVEGEGICIQEYSNRDNLGK